MSPHRQSIGAWPRALGLAACVVACGCERFADIRDEREESLIQAPPPIDAGTIPVLDAGLESDAHAPCGERPNGPCVGSNDFPCAFQDWAEVVAESCQIETGCKTNGYLELKMGADGCVSAIGMDQPNDEIVACLVAELGAKHCPCGETGTKYFFGTANAEPCGD